ncbi:MAG: hypothetical protein PHD54_02985 [Desulfuromonadaceae bacterium]|nr:hypothetical protein [Desulfuromonadaceae bacterium]
MPSPLTINYNFRFRNGEKREILLRFDKDNLALLPSAKHTPPEWAKLTLHRCVRCPLDPALHPHCPIAVQLSEIVNIFHEHNSFDEVAVEVTENRRRYLKQTSLQEGLSSLLGVIMAAGGCPVLEPLRPMVRFHLPFATIEETEFRMVSMYLVAQFLRQKRGEQPDWALDGLQTIYARIQEVNTSFVKRIRAAGENDAGINAIVILDCFAHAVPYAVKTLMRDYEKYFAPYSE